MPIESVWNKVEHNNEYISSEIIENNPEWFERVYQSNVDKLMFLSVEAFKAAVHFVK